jgi:hypothetical protein
MHVLLVVLDIQRRRPQPLRLTPYSRRQHQLLRSCPPHVLAPFIFKTWSGQYYYQVYEWCILFIYPEHGCFLNMTGAKGRRLIQVTCSRCSSWSSDCIGFGESLVSLLSQCALRWSGRRAVVGCGSDHRANDFGFDYVSLHIIQLPLYLLTEAYTLFSVSLCSPVCSL